MFPEVMKVKGMHPPPKHALHFGSSAQAMTERRRSELERWLWRLIARPEIARTPLLKAFFEFDRALLRAQQQLQPRQPNSSER